MSKPPKIVVLGMMTRNAVPGVIWQTVHYLVGLERLGCETYYVEAHGRTPKRFITDGDRGSAGAATFIAALMRRFGLDGRWALHALHEDGRCYGLSERELKNLYRSATAILNLHGGTHPIPEGGKSTEVVYVETDPVEVQLELYDGNQATIDILARHSAFFTFGESHGSAECKLPVSPLFDFKPTRQPVVLDFWSTPGDPPGEAFTTVGNWRQTWRMASFEGELYTWSKHEEFLRFVDLPSRTSQPFELAMSSGSYTEEDARLLESHGWRLRDALAFATDIDAYRRYIASSRGEFTVAKDQNVRFRTGWFSDRSATYLAAGRPVITQETGFSNVLPVGDGLFAFSSIDEIVGAVESVNGDYERHSRAAAAIAREYFSSDVVLRSLLAELGVSPSRRPAGARPAPDRAPFPPELVLEPLSRRPLELPRETVEAVLAAKPAARPRVRAESDAPLASIVVVAYGDLVFTKLCLESVLANTDRPSFEVIVVDNASGEETRAYLSELARADERVRVLSNDENVGFARATNQGLEVARGEVLVLLNNDTIVARGWLARLAHHLEDPAIGTVGPVTNRIGNEAQIGTSYRTYGEFEAVAEERARQYEGRLVDVGMLAMFCLAMRRDMYDAIGPLDERFEVGMLEDDDYALRVRAGGYRIAFAEDVLVHHFGEASFGNLVPTGEHGRLLAANKNRFEEKWGVPWTPYRRRSDPEYERVIERIREIARKTLPPDADVLVVSRGDEQLLRLNGCHASHFPQADGGVYAGHYPADSAEAISHLEDLRARGFSFLVLPKPAFWWLRRYPGFADHLSDRYPEIVRADNVCVIFGLQPGRGINSKER